MVLEVFSMSGMRFGIVFFAAFAALLGVGTRALVRRRGGRRGAALTGGTVLGVATFALVYSTSLDGFCRVDLRGDAVHLAYALPWRDTVITSEQILAIESRAGVRPFLAEIRLTLDDGRVLESASSDHERIALVERELRRIHRGSLRSPMRGSGG